MDMLGNLLKYTPGFRGKPRLIRYWRNRLHLDAERIFKSPSGYCLHTDVSIPYEAMVWLGLEETRDLRAFRDLIKPGAYFVDVGANIGLWTLAACRVVGENGRVIGFEPNPATFTKLQRNVVLNACAGRCEIVPSAVSNRSGDVWLSTPDEHNLSQVTGQGEDDTVKIRAVSLDGYLLDKLRLERLDGIKIDVEGWEQYVLEGASRILEQYHPWVITEFNPHTAAVSRIADWDVYAFFSDKGYKCFDLVGNTREPMPDLDAVRDHYLNLLFAKK